MQLDDIIISMMMGSILVVVCGSIVLGIYCACVPGDVRHITCRDPAGNIVLDKYTRDRIISSGRSDVLSFYDLDGVYYQTTASCVVRSNDK